MSGFILVVIIFLISDLKDIFKEKNVQKVMYFAFVFLIIVGSLAYTKIADEKSLVCEVLNALNMKY